MNTTIQFGDIFLHSSQEYVFLAQRDEIVYTAKILDKEKGNQIKKLCECQLKNPKISSSVKDKILFCYVELTTDKYQGKFAHLKGYDEKDESNIFPFELSGCSLNIKDLKALKSEILEGPVSKLLKNIVKDLDI